ncbi:single-stranded-DNA-specific exonuclease RecJ [Desulfofalx alkaliphila]|uniref:single-stranded-DNA-specific exonuclease RecJ n=1 Tax=Desulfofalx alkaliphila TaxID=105483 RepID=UPI0004E1E09C|nr:single-stranded-DNA-specific exonuclease RecJ [Desulfofalx alkaliphila]
MKKLTDMVTGILIKRGVPRELWDGFLDPALYKPTDPTDFPGIENAADYLQQAVDAGKGICVYGDYDVDGVTSTALLVSVLKSLGADVIYKVPDRFKEGYGLNAAVIKEMPLKGVDLILTCDCGIANVEEVALARQLGMDVIITDHHLLPDKLPEANGIVSCQLLPQNHRARHLPGVGVAYFLARLLLARYHREEEAEQYLDLVALGLVADVVPLTGENRYLLQRGLPKIRQAYRPGIKALLQVCNLNADELTEEHIAFQLAPLINAAGRMETAQDAVELLLCREEKAARPWAEKLYKINQQRRQVGDQMLAEAEALLAGPVGGAIVLYQPHWHQGIIGITAGRLCEKYRVPVVLMCKKDDGETIVGSARSVEGVHIYRALGKCADYLLSYGGHAAAAGLSLHRDQLTIFTGLCTKVLSEMNEQALKDAGPTYDLELPIGGVNSRLYYQLRRLAPFGEGWPQPLFYCPQVKVLNARPTTGDKHLRLVVEHGGSQMPAIYWWGGDKKDIKSGRLLYNLSVNRWQGEEAVQLVVVNLEEAEEAPAQARVEKQVIEVQDYRRWRELGYSPPQFNDALYFYEGPPLKDFPYRVNHRYLMTPADRLVLLTCPPDPRVLREVIALSGARKLVLAYSISTSPGLSDVIKTLMGYLKYIINRRGGSTDVFELAAVTGHTELLVMKLIRHLQRLELLEVQMPGRGQMLIKPSQKKGKKKAPPEPLKKLLNESNAYRRFMLQAGTEQLLAQLP